MSAIWGHLTPSRVGARKNKESMSYFNWLNLQYVDPFAETIVTVDRESELKAYLATIGVHPDVAKDLSQLFSTGSAEIRLHTALIDELLNWISKEWSSIDFGIQGRGEERRDVWVREYTAGTCTFSQGPFLD